MRLIYFLISTIIVKFYSPVYPQNLTSDPVARVGLKSISQEEFIKRYEFTPGLERQIKSRSETAKLEFLYTLIAEKLWAQEAITLGLDTTEVIEFSKREYKKIFVRDALYKREILDKARISEKELIEGIYRYHTKLKVNFLFTENESEINNLYSILVNGIEFDSILSIRPEAEEQIDPIEVVYGQMDEAIEDSLYKLNIDEYTHPILTPDGWYIFKLTNRIETMIGSEKNLEDSKQEVERIIKARKSAILYSNFFQSFFSRKEVEVNPKLFNSLTEKISESLRLRDNKNFNNEKNEFSLNSDDVILIEEKFGADSLKMIFLNFESNPITLKQFIRILIFDGFISKEYDKKIVSVFLDKKIRTIIEHELLAREGFKRGYQSLPEVLAEVNMWVDNYLFQVLKNKFIDSVYVTEKEVHSLYRSITDKQEESSANRPTESKMNELKRKFIFQKANSKMNSFTVNLAIKYGVGIDFDLLDAIEVTNLSSFAIRGLGFGGRLSAVPMLAPNVEWVQPWLDRINVIQ